MRDFRAVLAIFIFFISIYFIYDLFASGFNIYLLISALVGFVLVHILWPRKCGNDSSWYDSLEIVFDLPYRAMAMCVRGFSGKGDKSDIDFDI